MAYDSNKTYDVRQLLKHLADKLIDGTLATSADTAIGDETAANDAETDPTLAGTLLQFVKGVLSFMRGNKASGTLSGDGTEGTLGVDCEGKGAVLVKFDVPAGASAVYKIMEGIDSADADKDEIKSGSLTAGAVTYVRTLAPTGGYLEASVTSTGAAVDVSIIAH